MRQEGPCHLQGRKPILNGATPENFEEMSAIATEAGVTLGVHADSLSELHDLIAKLEAAGNKNLIIDVTGKTVKETFANTVLVRRTALKDGDRTFGYPSIVDLPSWPRATSILRPPWPPSSP